MAMSRLATMERATLTLALAAATRPPLRKQAIEDTFVLVREHSCLGGPVPPRPRRDRSCRGRRGAPLAEAARGPASWPWDSWRGLVAQRAIARSRTFPCR